MKVRTGKLSIIFTAFLTLIVMIVSVCLFAACGGTDYSKFDWYDFDEITQEQWNNKTISYQLFAGNMEDFSQNGATMKSFEMANLYSDGTIVVYQIGAYMPEPERVTFYDPDNYVRAVFYGTWTTYAKVRDTLDEGAQTDIGEIADTDLVIRITKRYVNALSTWYYVPATFNGETLSASMITVGSNDTNDGETKKVSALSGTSEVVYQTFDDFHEFYFDRVQEYVEAIQ